MLGQDFPSTEGLLSYLRESNSHQFMSSEQPGPSRERLVKTNWNRFLFVQINEIKLLSHMQS